MSAYNDIYINAPITSSHSSGKLSLLYGQGSSSGTISGLAADYHVNAPVSLAAGANFSTQLGSNAANLKSYQVITRRWPLDQTASPFEGNLATALFIESGWVQVYRRPWSGNTDNQAKLSGAGVSLSWNAPKHWSASLSLSHALGKTPSLLAGSASLHTSAWVELVRKFY